MKRSAFTRYSFTLLFVLSLLSPFTVLAAGDDKKHFKEGMKHEEAEQWDLAAEAFALAVVESPKNPEYRLHLRRSLFNASQMYMAKGRLAAEQKDYQAAYVAFRKAYVYDPVNELAKNEMDKMVRLQERGLETGPWLQELKRLVLAGAGDDTPVALPDGPTASLGEVRELVTISPGQKVAYVTDVADTPANRAAIAQLASGADLFFLESRFAAADGEQARERAHLTTTAAGEIARAAGVRRLEPFHFSPRYDGEEDRMISEVMSAFEGAPAQTPALEDAGAEP
jgi:tetratricopeptide (TPR) repeat protein